MVTPSIGTIELYKQLQILLKSDMPVFIHGSPGIGKSYIVNDIAKKSNPFFYLYYHAKAFAYKWKYL